jgi:hypothetical protein
MKRIAATILDEYGGTDERAMAVAERIMALTDVVETEDELEAWLGQVAECSWRVSVTLRERMLDLAREDPRRHAMWAAGLAARSLAESLELGFKQAKGEA